MAGVPGRSGGDRTQPARPVVVEVTGPVPRCPTSLDKMARAFWRRDAKIAHRLGTLTEATVGEFADLCRLMVLIERLHLMLAVEFDLQLVKEIRALTARVESKRKNFLLSPHAKPVRQEEPPEPDDPVDAL